MNNMTRVIGLQPDKEMPREPFVAEVTIHIKPDCIDEFLHILNQVADAVRGEPTLVSNVAHQDPEDPTKFMLWEIWADQKDFFEVQMLKEYRKPYETRLPDLLAEPRVVRIWKPLRGHMTVALPNLIKTS